MTSRRVLFLRGLNIQPAGKESEKNAPTGLVGTFVVADQMRPLAQSSSG